MSDSRQAEPELVKRAREGDAAAFSTLFEELYRPILNYVFHTVGDQPTAEDITQEAFIRAHRNLDKLGPPWDFKSWVYRIASNLVIDHLRHNKRYVDLNEQVIMGEPPTTRRPAERKLQREDAVRSVHTTLEEMPTGYRQALILRELNGLSYKQMASAMGCSYANARQLVHRARVRFRDMHLARLTIAESAARCPVLGDMLSAYHDDELTPEQRREVEEHMADCPDCLQTREEFQKVGALVAGLVPIMPSPGFAEGVLQQIKLDMPGKPMRKPERKPSPDRTRRLDQGEADAPGKQPDPASSGGAPAGGKGGGGGWLHSMMGSIGGQIAVGLLGGGIVLAGLAIGFKLLSGDPTPTPPPPTNSSSTEAESSPTSAVAVIVDTEEAPVETEETEVVITVSPTPPEDPPLVEALLDSNCRYGPRDIYEMLASFLTGETAYVHGRNYTSTWWWIEYPEAGEHCWVWDGSVELTGDASDVPVIPDPPTPIPPDSAPPVVTISYQPVGRTRPTSAETITFTAMASDDVGVARMEIWVRSSTMNVYQMIGSCTAVETCVITAGPYAPGTLLYYATAEDAAGHHSETSIQSLTVYSPVN